MPIYDFIEIGTSDFETLIDTATDDMYGLSIEPIQYYLDRLPVKQNVKKINCAVSNNNGWIDINYIHPDTLQQYNLPDYLRGCNSIGKVHPTAQMIVRNNNLDESAIFRKDRIRVIDFETLCKEHDVEGIRYLKVDTEGHDCVILQNMFSYAQSNPDIMPQKILFESNILSNDRDIIDVILEASKYNYKVVYSETGGWGGNTLLERTI
jgi:FkbM family methyltransferase